MESIISVVAPVPYKDNMGRRPHSKLRAGCYPIAMNPILLILVLLLVFGGGGFYFGGPVIGGGGVGLLLLICLIIYCLGGLRSKRS